MRYLHPVTLKEKFVASGVYTFYVGGELQKTTETWVIHRQPDGEYFVRLDYDDRDHSGVSVLTEILCTPDYDALRVDTYHLTSPNKSIRTSYTRMEGYLQVGRSIDGGEREYEEVELPDDVCLRPPSYLLDGFLMLKGDSLVVLPPTPYLLRVEQYRVEPISAGHYLWQHENEQPSHLWLNAHQIPVRIEQGKHLTMVLTKYSHI